jgi:hypothetical protein
MVKWTEYMKLNVKNNMQVSKKQDKRAKKKINIKTWKGIIVGLSW